MRVEHLYYLCELAKYSSMNKAAEELFISQSTLRSAICVLEDELGVALVQSTRHGTQLTAFGMRVVEESEKIFEYVDGWKRDGKFSHDIKEDITIGITQIASYTIFQSNIFNIKKEYPNLTLYLARKTAPEIIQQLKLGKYCMGMILAAPDDEEKIRKELEPSQLNLKLMCEDEMLLCINRDSPLALYDEISINDLMEYCYCGYSVLEMWPNEDYYFFTNGFSDKNVVHVDAAENIINLVSHNINSYAMMIKTWQSTPCFSSNIVMKKPIDMGRPTTINHYLIHKNIIQIQ